MSLRQIDYGRKSSEQGNAQFRPFPYCVKALKANSEVPVEAVRSVRPGFGAAPKYLSDVIGRRV